ncbi:MAG: hypothetical protein DHS80DRAFT_13070 [Piptocephalis tieghemiana]|nr:MAG: hypothetical protein DHS80DRAFT_13070 [Piptocephalis tieghemiana]
MSAAPPASFASSFWGEDDQGVEVLMTKLRHSKQTMQDVQWFFAQRASIEEDYGKKLSKLAKATLGKEEGGTLKEAIVGSREEIASIGRAHLELAGRIRAELDAATGKFIDVQREQRKAQTAIVEKSARSKGQQAHWLHKVRERYESEMAKGGVPVTTLPPSPHPSSSHYGGMSAVKDKLSRIGGGGPGAGGKDIETEYKEAVNRLELATHRFQEDWLQACDKFQVMEEDRIEFLRNILWNYTNVCAAVCVSDDEAYERMRKCLERCDIDADILHFIEAKGTGVAPASISQKITMATTPAQAPSPAQPPTTTSSHPSHDQFSSKGPVPSSHPSPSFSSSSSSSGPQGPVDSAISTTTPPSSQPQSQSHSRSSSTSVKRQQDPTSSSSSSSSIPETTAPSSTLPPDHSTTAPPPPIPSGVSTVYRYEPAGTANHPGQPPVTGAPPPNVPSSITSSSGPQVPQVPSGPQGAQPSPSSSSSIHPQGGGPVVAGAADTTQAQQQPHQPPHQLPPQRPVLFHVKALYDYEPQIPEEIGFREGDTIAVFATQLDGWWEGQVSAPDGRILIGQFPSNFTEPLTF